jgi:site-specific DNA recombinase
MQLIAYLRVSTREQAESGLGLEAQREACVRAAAAMGEELDDAAIYVDAGVSGGEELDRCPALLAALDALEAGGVLMVAKRDRLGRDAYRLALIERLAARAGAQVVSADGTGNGDDPAAMLLRRMVDAFAEYERQLIQARTRAALRAKKVRGERVGAPPWGYRVGADGVTLEADAGEQRIVALVRRAAGRGLSHRAIARELDAAGVRTRSGQPFNHAAVGRILAAELAPVLEARAAEVAQCAV